MKKQDKLAQSPSLFYKAGESSAVLILAISLKTRCCKRQLHMCPMTATQSRPNQAAPKRLLIFCFAPTSYPVISLLSPFVSCHVNFALYLNLVMCGHPIFLVLRLNSMSSSALSSNTHLMNATTCIANLVGSCNFHLVILVTSAVASSYLLIDEFT